MDRTDGHCDLFAKRQARVSGIELCRILAMLMIIAGHFIGQSGLRTAHASSTWLWFYGSGARWAVNLFLIISCWFMVDSRFKAERIARLYLTVLFYSVPLTILAFVLWKTSTKDVFRSFIPFLGRPLWFVSAYISLALVAPWLKFAIKLPQKSLGTLVSLLIVVVPGICTLPDPQMCYVADVCYFFFVFILVGFLKPILSSSNKYMFVALITGIALYSALVVLQRSGIGLIQGWAAQCLSDFKTLPNLASALLVFYFFLHLNIGSVKWINFVASSAFAVYVIHSTPAFYDFLWNGIFQTKKWMVSTSYPLYSTGVIVAVYLFGILLEFPRRLIIDKWLFSFKTVQKTFRKIDDAYAKVN